MIRKQLEAQRKRRKFWQGITTVAMLLILVVLVTLYLFVR